MKLPTRPAVSESLSLPLSLCLSPLLVLAVVGCDSSHRSGGTQPLTFQASVEHPYLPIAPGTTWIYEGEESGLSLREEVFAQPQPAVIGGVACQAVTQRVVLDGQLVEVTTEWYAQDSRGNVWKFGQECRAPAGGQLIATEESWQAGVDGAEPWMVLSADPRPGQEYFGYSTAGQLHFAVRSVSASAMVEAGTFPNCLELVEDPEDPDDTDIILYAPGVGRVQEQSTGGSIGLVSVHRQ